MSDDAQSQETIVQIPGEADNPDLERQRRLRTLTEKGENVYQDTKRQFQFQLDAAWKDLESVLASATDCQTNIKSLNILEENLVRTVDIYMSRCDEYERFLLITSTNESSEELKRHIDIRLEHKAIVNRLSAQLKKLKQDALENLTVGSNASGKSSTHTVSSSSTQLKRAKANAQRARLEYVKKQADLLKQKAELEGMMHVLKQEEIVAAAEAEAQTLEQVIHDTRSEHEHLTNYDIREQLTATDRVRKYVDEQAQSVTRVFPTVEHQNMPEARPPTTSIQEHRVPRFNDFDNDENIVTSLTHFLLRKDLILSRLTKFTDAPEYYSTWKETFRSVTNELKLSKFEEMDMLVKYLGPVSSGYATSIRMSNVNNPDKGVIKIWERLEDRYGQPEMVENALKSRLERFPKVTEWNFRKLFELIDLLSEIESVKENPKYAALLSYFDTSAGVIPVMKKLPASLQAKWTTRAAKYKQDKGVAFPPFSVFVRFIGEMSKILNDPGLVYDDPTPTAKNTTTYDRSLKVSVKKSQVSNQTNERDPDNFCPFHKTSKHSLGICKGFRASLLKLDGHFLRTTISVLDVVAAQNT